jgi:hypothetical protein
MKRNSITAILQDLKKQKDAFEETRRMIYAMHFEGIGYASIARILNERKRPSRKGGKWHGTSVKRELEGLHKGYTKCPTITSGYIDRANMDSERADRQSQATTAETQQAKDFQEEDIQSGSFEDVTVGDDACDSELSGKVLPYRNSELSEWSTPALIEMPYTNVLRQLYREKVPEAA